MRSPRPLSLEVGPSRLLLVYLILVHTLAAAALWLTLPTVYALLLISLVSGYFCYLRRPLSRANSSKLVKRISFANNAWRVTDPTGQARTFDCEGATVLPWLLVLIGRVQLGRRQDIVIFRDQLNADDFRRLRQIALFHTQH
jgi:hypothetical protein